MTTRPVFESELEDLRRSVATMGQRVMDTYDRLFEAIKAKNEDLIKTIMKNDREINEMERTVEAKCLSLITRQQPVAKDLRMVTANLKVVTDIERIGDHVADMAELILRLDMKELEKISTHISGMIDATRELMNSAMKVFINRRDDMAQGVITGDDIIDDYFNKIKKDIVNFLKNETKDEDECIDLLMIGKYLERIGDHAVNIAEWEMFQERGAINNVRLL